MYTHTNMWTNKYMEICVEKCARKLLASLLTLWPTFENNTGNNKNEM